MKKVLTEIVGEKWITEIIVDYVEDLNKYEELQRIDNKIMEELEDMELIIGFNTKSVKHEISKKLLRKEQELGVNVLGINNSDDEYDSDEDMAIKKYYEKKVQMDKYDIENCRDNISHYGKKRYKLLGSKEFNDTPIIKRNDFIISDSDSD